MQYQSFVIHLWIQCIYQIAYFSSWYLLLIILSFSLSFWIAREFRLSVFKPCLCFPSDPICDHYVAFTFQQGLVGHFNTLKNNLDPSITRPFKPCATLHLFNVFRSREFIDIRPLPDCLLSRHCLVQPIRTTHRSSCELNFLFLPHETAQFAENQSPINFFSPCRGFDPPKILYV